MRLLKSLISIALIVSACFTTHLFAQQEVRYQSDIFPKIDSITNIQYGEAVNINKENQKLLLDIYMPQSDTEKKRPLLIGVHGGGFVNGNKSGGFQLTVCKALAKKGYVTTSIGYRLGVEKPRTNTAYFEAMYRAVQDAKAAVRFFRKNADLYGIDTSKIYVLGSSAGSMTVLQLAYLDQNEVPTEIDIKKLGTLEGTSGNAGFSSKVHGVVDCWGAMIDYKWINKGDVPLYCIHGTADSTVPYDASYAYHGFAYGSKILYEQALAVGIPTGLRLFEKAGHNIGKENSAVALQDIIAWLFDRVQNKDVKNGIAITKAPTRVTKNAANRQFTVLDFNKIEKVKASIKEKKETYKTAYENLLKAADKALKAELTSVVQKTQVPPSGDKHDYLSLAPYFWPDPTKADGLPWIRKDGEVNPLTRGKNVDEPVKDVMMTSARNLAYAFYFSDDKKYAKRAVDVLQTWFVNEDTKMNPHLDFGQGIPGVNTGRCFGIIEFTGILDIITAIEMLRSDNSLDEKTDKALTKWLSDYANWLQTSKIGLEEKATVNNHGTWYDTQVVAILLFLKRDTEAKVVLEGVKKRIDHQIDTDGKQPEELARTKALSYSTMNLTAFSNLAYFGKAVGVDLWNYTNPKGGSLKKAYDFLQPYATGAKAWNFKQIGGHLEEDIEKLSHLFIKMGSMMDIKTYCEMASKLGDKTYPDMLIRPIF